MRSITHKYSVGDYVRFKSKFTNPTCGLAEKAETVAKITGVAPSYNNKPHYYLDNEAGVVYPETLFVGRYED